MTKGAPLALTLMNYEQTNFASDGRGVTVPAFQYSKNSFHNMKQLAATLLERKFLLAGRKCLTCLLFS